MLGIIADFVIEGMAKARQHYETRPFKPFNLVRHDVTIQSDSIATLMGKLVTDQHEWRLLFTPLDIAERLALTGRVLKAQNG